mmetsp:Transcript_10169/g.23819  ORF Transcript_10169/g.23819 Transcript_10169/m.23819 type:complete len:326 (+) Transcript_10169:2342-3319(+)
MKRRCIPLSSSRSRLLSSMWPSIMPSNACAPVSRSLSQTASGRVPPPARPASRPSSSRRIPASSSQNSSYPPPLYPFRDENLRVLPSLRYPDDARVLAYSPSETFVPDSSSPSCGWRLSPDSRRTKPSRSRTRHANQCCRADCRRCRKRLGPPSSSPPPLAAAAAGANSAACPADASPNAPRADRRDDLLASRVRRTWHERLTRRGTASRADSSWPGVNGGMPRLCRRLRDRATCLSTEDANDRHASSTSSRQWRGISRKGARAMPLFLEGKREGFQADVPDATPAVRCAMRQPIDEAKQRLPTCFDHYRGGAEDAEVVPKISDL